MLALAEALETARLALPGSEAQVRRYVCGPEAAAVAQQLARLAGEGLQPGHLAAMLRLLAAEREAVQRTADRVELVWTGPETPGAGSRDTSVVVGELFATARSSVLVSSFAVYQGREVFAPLARRMDELPDLQVRMFLNVSRPQQDSRPDGHILRAFAAAFREQNWPGSRLPEIFHDPRALAQGSGPRSCLHAKCVVVDQETAFVTSANFTEAAQERNIEAGVLLRSHSLARALTGQFESLVTAGALRRLLLW
jgi:phosphatidylserine/phosphatidylglycerophosphate/cardiolipin synthase-like enzyme